MIKVVEFNIDYSFLLDLIDKKYNAKKIETKINMCCKEAHVKQSAFKYAMTYRRTFTGEEILKLAAVLGISVAMIGYYFFQVCA